MSVFIGSGHINTRKIIELDTNAYSEGKRYTVALHEFLRAIVYEDYQDYFPDASDIANLFDVIESSREHFISSLCLDYLLRKSNSSQNGFISTNDIIEYLQDSGFKFHQIEHCLLRLVYKGLLETEARKLLNLGDSLPKSIRITSIGSYHLQKLISSFVYIDAIIVDVPIFNEQIRAGVKDEQQIFYRLKRCQSFCKYLDDCWADAGFTNTGFDWPQVSENLKKEIARIEHSLH